MTYRNDGSYLHFSKSMKKKAGNSFQDFATEMNSQIEKKHRLQEELAVTESQNVFDAAEIEE
ncbi:MAG: hypothetical protein H6Q67_1953 [Firmicutes bacterium]|nr:hypothetical protein [Bacillota bacterium]